MATSSTIFATNQATIPNQNRPMNRCSSMLMFYRGVDAFVAEVKRLSLGILFVATPDDGATLFVYLESELLCLLLVALDDLHETGDDVLERVDVIIPDENLPVQSLLRLRRRV